MKYLDLTGLQLFWAKIKHLVANTPKVSAGNGVSVGNVITDPAATGYMTQSVSINLASAANGLTVGAEGLGLSLATDSAAGAMSSAAYTKLNGIAEGAQVNVIEDVYVNGQQASITNKVAYVTNGLDDLSDVSVSSASENQYLRFNGTNWTAYSLPAAVEYTLVAKETPAEAYAAQYDFKKDGVTQTTINIPKDQFLKNASFIANAGAVPAGKTAPGTDFPYLLFEWQNSDQGATIADTWIPCKSLVDIYTEGNGIDITNNVVSAVVDSTNANGLSVGANGLALATVVASTSGEGGSNGAMTASQAEKLAGISTGATKVTDGATNGYINIDGTETEVYVHHTQTAANAAAVMVGNDSEGHVVLGDALTASNLAYSGTTTIYDKISAMDAATADYLTAANILTTASAGISLAKSGTGNKDFQVSVTPGSVASGDTSVVTGGAAYTAIENAKSALLGDATTYTTLGLVEDKLETIDTAHTGGSQVSNGYFVITSTNASGHVTGTEAAEAITDSEINALS